MNGLDEAKVRAAAAARTSYGRLLALLASSSGDLAAAEDALGDAFERALRVWPEQGVPDSPDGWLLTVARNRLRDHWKSAAATRNVPLDVERDGPAYLDHVDPEEIPDKRLELMLVCAHPAIEPSARTPLMLNTVLGFTAAQIGRSFNVPAATMSTRLLRAKRRVKHNRIPFRLPDSSHLAGRMESVLEAVYGAFVIDWASTGAETRDVPRDALQLAEILTELVPDDPEAHGLAALVELCVARRTARIGPHGVLVPLAEQDPARWDGVLIAHAHGHLRTAHAHHVLGRFQLEAAIQAVHCARRETGRTDWATLRGLYEALNRVAPTLGSITGLAVVAAETDGAEAGLRILDSVGERTRRFQPTWAARAHLLARLGRREEAEDAYAKAISLTHDTAERRHLQRRREQLR